MHVDVYWFCQVPVSLDTLLGQILPPPQKKKTFLLSVLSVESYLKIEDNEEEKAEQHHNCGHIRRR